MTFIKDLKDHVGEEVTLKGWVYNKRSSGPIAFLEFRDGSGFTQIVADKEALRQAQGDIWGIVESLTIESSVEIIGEVRKHPKKEGVFEIGLKDVKVISLAQEYPIGKKDHGPDFLLENRHLWLRSPSQWAVQKVRDVVIHATYDWMRENGFMKFDSPILTPSACEGTTELFEIEYFDIGKAYLTQSGQLYLEAALASFGRVFDFGPVFRAEKSKTRRHLTEFWMMDAEAAFVDHVGNMEIQEQLISFIVKKVIESCSIELKTLERDIEPLKNVVAPFYRITHKEAIEKLRALGSDIKDDDDLGADDETILTRTYDKPIFVEKYPAHVKAFYMKPDPSDPTRVLNADLLAPEGYGEIIGGSEREDDYERLLAKIKEHNLPVDAFEWYLDARRYGSVPHSGFGFGLERIVAWVCGLKHVRETIPFPRMLNRIYP